MSKTQLKKILAILDNDIDEQVTDNIIKRVVRLKRPPSQVDTFQDGIDNIIRIDMKKDGATKDEIAIAINQIPEIKTQIVKNIGLTKLGEEQEPILSRLRAKERTSDQTGALVQQEQILVLSMKSRINPIHLRNC